MRVLSTAYKRNGTLTEKLLERVAFGQNYTHRLKLEGWYISLQLEPLGRSQRLLVPYERLTNTNKQAQANKYTDNQQHLPHTPTYEHSNLSNPRAYLDIYSTPIVTLTTDDSTNQINGQT